MTMRSKKKAKCYFFYLHSQIFLSMASSSSSSLPEEMKMKRTMNEYYHILTKNTCVHGGSKNLNNFIAMGGKKNLELETEN